MSEGETGRSLHPSILMWLMSRVVVVRQQIVLVAQGIMREQHISNFLDMAAVYSVQHPIMTIFLISMAFCCGIPVLMFIVFAVLTVILTFTGFMLVEGTILTMGSVLVSGFMLGMFIVVLALAATVGVAYFGFMEVYGLFQSSPENSPVSRYMPRTVTKQESHTCSSKSQMNAGEQQLNDHHDD